MTGTRVAPAMPMPPHEFAGHDWHDAPAAPLDVLAWLDERDCQLHATCSHLHPIEPSRSPPPVLVRTHRLRGPPELDADIVAIDSEMRACFRAQAQRGARVGRVSITLVSRREMGPLVVALEPTDTPMGLQACLVDVVGDMRAFATAPVVIVAGAPM